MSGNSHSRAKCTGIHLHLEGPYKEVGNCRQQHAFSRHRMVWAFTNPAWWRSSVFVQSWSLILIQQRFQWFFYRGQWEQSELQWNRTSTPHFIFTILLNLDMKCDHVMSRGLQWRSNHGYMSKRFSDPWIRKLATDLIVRLLGLWL